MQTTARKCLAGPRPPCPTCTPPELPPGLCSAPLPTPPILRLSSLGNTSTKSHPPYFGWGQGHRHCHQHPPPFPLLRGHGDTLTHQVPAASRAGLLPSFPKQPGLLASPNTTMATAGTQREEAVTASGGGDGAAEAEGTGMPGAQLVPTGECWPPQSFCSSAASASSAEGRPRKHHKSPGLPNCFKI